MGIERAGTVGALLLLAGSVLLWGCGDSGQSGGTPSGPTAVLSVRETGNLPGMLAIDATESDSGRDGSFSRFVIDILDDQGEQRREIVIEDRFDQTIPHVLPEEDDAIAQHLRDHGEPKNIRGSYRIALTVETEDGSSDRAEAVVNLDRDIQVVHFTQLEPAAAASSSARTAAAVLGALSSSDDDSDCPSVSCSIESAADSENGESYVACVPDASCDTVYPSVVLTVLQSVLGGSNVVLSDTAPLVISAYGAAGADGCDYEAYDGGNGGKGGFVQLFTTVADLEDQYGDTLYYYLGDKGGCKGFTARFLSSDTEPGGGDGGASTIVSYTDTGSSSSGHFEQSDVLLVAGGGGGGGSGAESGYDGKDGGHGGYDLYAAEEDYTYDDGEDAPNIDDYQCEDSQGGTGDSSKIGGYGGYGSDANRYWLDTTPPVGSHGAGGDADYHSGDSGDDGNPGGGGGGAGGGQAGGAGHSSGETKYCGGGGGASLAAPSTYFDLAFEPDGRTSHDSDGAVYLYFFTSQS